MQFLPSSSDPGFVREPTLRQQIAECRDRILRLISEGFGQKTDRHCAHYQYLARGSANELRAHHLAVACGTLSSLSLSAMTYQIDSCRSEEADALDSASRKRENRTRRG